MLKTRNFSLDALRALAAISIAVFHILQCAANSDSTISVQTYTLATALSTILQITSCFFIITGYIWLSSGKECTYPKMLPNIRRFILVLFSIGFVYAVMERFFNTRTLSLNLLLASFTDVLTGNLWDHMWYLYAIIGVYLILPVLKPFFQYSSVKELSVFIGILFVFEILSSIVTQTTGYELPMDIHLSEHLFYICIGGLFAKLSLSRKTASISAAVCGISNVLIFIIEAFAPEYSIWTSLLACISAVSLFLVITILLKDTPEIHWVRSIANCSFGIYLFHPFFINVIIKLFGMNPLYQRPFLSVIGMSFVVVGLSYAFTYFLRKIRWIKKYIL